MPNSKRGVALLITIGFLTVLTALIAHMFSISQKSFDEANKIDAKNQSVIVFSSVKTMLDEYAKEVKDSDALSMFLFGVPPFYDEKSDLSLYVEIEPLNNKLNINSLLINPHIKDVFKNICETYHILDSDFFIALLLDTIDTDEVSRASFSEISMEDIKFSNSSIIDMNHFKKILKYYVEIAKDETILSVPWDKLIYFGKKEKTILDCDRLNDELITALKLEEEFVDCDSIQTPEQKALATKYNLKPFDIKSSYFVHVSIFYQVEDKKDSVQLKYDLKTKKTSDLKQN